MSTLAARIHLALAAALADITTANGYATDMGLRVYRGRSHLSFAPQDLELGPVAIISSVDGEDHETVVQRVGKKLRNELKLSAQAVALCDDDNPLDTADELLGDLKRALLRPDSPGLSDAAGFLSEAVEYVSARFDLPAPGEQIVLVDMRLTCRYAEAYGKPDTASA